jgi:hypothetical protein
LLPWVGVETGKAYSEEPGHNPVERQTEPEIPAEAEHLVTVAREMLAEMLAADTLADDIALVSVEMKQWRDSSMGCPQDGMMYLMVITPGYLIELEAGGKHYAFHTNRFDRVVLCTIDGEKVSS